jgi:hypothetical protein
MPTSSRRIKLMADYGCSPLWDMINIYNIDPSHLQLSDTTQKDLDNWATQYDETLNHDDPPASNFKPPLSLKLFNLEGHRLWTQLKKELPDYEVFYFDEELNVLLKEFGDAGS